VLVNLLGNAAKFTDRLGTVELSLSIEGGTAVVAVRDTGIGIPPSDQAKLFDRFFRSSVAHERAIQGSGLGLSIARAIVETHGGRIDVESGEGVGSIFRVRLPLEGQQPVSVQDQLAALAEPVYEDETDDVLAS
jgi:signal transduction histidine kinase